MSYLTLDPADENAMSDVLGHSITYRVAVGPRAGQKVFTLQTVPPMAEGELENRGAQAAGFSLHAGVREDRAAVPLRHASRGIDGTLGADGAGTIRYRLKTPYRDGTTHVVFEPLDFLARLAALVPLPRAHLTRYHGVFAPDSRLRSLITPARRGCARTRCG